MKPQDEQNAAFRALCLGALITRGEIEHNLRTQDDDDHREEFERDSADLSAWANTQDVSHYLSEHEKELFARPAGEWTRQEIINAGWRTEGLGCLLWALSLLEEIPPYDVKFNMQLLLDETGIGQNTRAFLQCVSLRPISCLEHSREVAELWHWRSRTNRLERNHVSGPMGAGFTGMLRQAVERAFYQQDIPRPIRGDFPAFGKPYAELTSDEYSRITSTAYERHHALNWLCGYTRNWDETSNRR
jgi:hypothetical protein